MKITKKQQVLAETIIEIKKEIKEEVIKERIENLARGMDWFDKIKLFLKI